DEKTGFFGFFESVQDETVAVALLEAAERWLRGQGMERVLGPVSFSTNEEAPLGLLIDGFEHPTTLMTAYNPRWYATLIEAGGYAKAKDLFAYAFIDTGGAP